MLWMSEVVENLKVCLMTADDAHQNVCLVLFPEVSQRDFRLADAIFLCDCSYCFDDFLIAVCGSLAESVDGLEVCPGSRLPPWSSQTPPGKRAVYDGLHTFVGT